MNKSDSISNLAAALVKAQAIGDPHQESPAIVAISRELRPLTRRHKNGTIADRFFEKVVFGAADCWYWRGSLNRLGYGCMAAMGESKAHRISYRLFKGEIAPGMLVLHHCDVRNCVNPDHLYQGTQHQNMRDCVSRGRHRSIPKNREDNPMARLTMESVLAMREIYAKGGVSYKKVGGMFGVSTMTALRAITGKSWGQA